MENLTEAFDREMAGKMRDFMRKYISPDFEDNFKKIISKTPKEERQLETHRYALKLLRKFSI